MTRKTVPCKWCGEPTPMLGTEQCDNCYEVWSRLMYTLPARALRGMLAELGINTTDKGTDS